MFTYIDILPSDLQHELYYYFTYKKLYALASNDSKVKSLVYNEKFLHSKGGHRRNRFDVTVNEKDHYYYMDKYFIKIIQAMMIDYLKIISTKYNNEPMKTYTLINENHYHMDNNIVFQASNKYKALMDIILFLDEHDGIYIHTCHFLTDILHDDEFSLPIDQMVEKLIEHLRNSHREHIRFDLYSSLSVHGF